MDLRVVLFVVLISLCATLSFAQVSFEDEIRSEMDSILRRLSEKETHISQIDESMVQQQAKITALEKQVTDQENRIALLEGRENNDGIVTHSSFIMLYKSCICFIASFLFLTGTKNEFVYLR